MIEYLFKIFNIIFSKKVSIEKNKRENKKQKYFTQNDYTKKEILLKNESRKINEEDEDYKGQMDMLSRYQNA